MSEKGKNLTDVNPKSVAWSHYPEFPIFCHKRSGICAKSGLFISIIIQERIMSDSYIHDIRTKSDLEFYFQQQSFRCFWEAHNLDDYGHSQPDMLSSRDVWIQLWGSSNCTHIIPVAQVTYEDINSFLE